MKAITLWQPYAAAIALGYKTFETRSWATNHRGPIAIHAAAQWNAEQQKFYDYAAGVVDMTGAEQLGCIVAVANLTECYKTEDLISQLKGLEMLFGDYRRGRYAWKLNGTIPLLKPIPYKGQQGLFNIDQQEYPELLRLVGPDDVATGGTDG